MQAFYYREQRPFLEKAPLFRIFHEALASCFAPSGRVLRLERLPKVKELSGRSTRE